MIGKCFYFTPSSLCDIIVEIRSFLKCMILKVIGWKEGADVTDLADMSTLEMLENKDVFIIKRNMY